MKELTINHTDDMTVAMVSDTFDIHHTTVSKYVKKLFPDKVKNGVVTLLNEEEVTAIKLNIQQNQHLSRSSKLPKTDLEKKLLIQQAIGFLNEEIEDLKQEIESQSLQLEEAQPKIEFHDQVKTSVNSITVAEFANLLTKKGFKTGQNKLFKFFYDNKYLVKSNRPYQTYMNSGLFEVKKVTYLDHKEEERTAHKVLVTGKGQIYFSKKLITV
jgi:phage antirepressor YoqD-like protein